MNNFELMQNDKSFTKGNREIEGLENAINNNVDIQCCFAHSLACFISWISTEIINTIRNILYIWEHVGTIIYVKNGVDFHSLFGLVNINKCELNKCMFSWLVQKHFHKYLEKSWECLKLITLILKTHDDKTISLFRATNLCHEKM